MKKVIARSIFVLMLSSIVLGLIGLGTLFNSKSSTRTMENFNAFSSEVRKMGLDFQGTESDDNEANISSAIDNNAENVFNSKRLIVRADGKIDTRGAVAHADGFDDYHVLQYETEQQARDALNYYISLNNVKYAVPDIEMILNPEPASEIFGSTIKNFDIQTQAPNLLSTDGFLSWGAKTIGAGSYHEYLENLDTLNDVVVAVIDTGLDTEHGFFEGRIAEGARNFVFLREDEEAYVEMVRELFGDTVIDRILSEEGFVFDFEGHGTHVAGTIVDLTLPNVKVLPVQVTFSGGGHTVLSSIVLGIEYVAQLQQEEGNIVAANMSFGMGSNFMPEDLNDIGFEGITQAIGSAVNSLHNSGVLPVAAAGNQGVSDSYFSSPANLDNVITVSAVGKRDEQWSNQWGVGLASFTSWGEPVDIAAPGEDILSAIPKDSMYFYEGMAVNIDGDWYQKMSGTSMASPHAAAAVALIKSDSSRQLSNQEVRDILFFNARDNGILGTDMFYGNGILSVRYASAEMITEPISFSRTQDEFISEFELSMAIDNENTKIFYTLDGTIPTTNSAQYTFPVTIDKTTVVRAIAYEIDDNDKVIAKSDDFHVIYYKVVNEIVQDIENPWEVGNVNGEHGVIRYEHGIIRYNGVLKDLIIPEYINGEKIDGIAPYAFFQSTVESVVLPDSIEVIGQDAFYGAVKLKNIYAPNVTEIEERAFQSNISLKSVTDENFPKLEIIKNGAFKACFSLEYVNLSNVKVINSYAFYWTVVKTAIFPNVEDFIGAPTFESYWGVKDLEKTIVLGKDIIYIGNTIVGDYPGDYEKILIDGVNVVYIRVHAFDQITINDKHYYYNQEDGKWYNSLLFTGAHMDAEWEAKWRRFFNKDGQWVIIDGVVIEVDDYFVRTDGSEYVLVVNRNYKYAIPSSVIIKGYKGTEAESYAAAYGNTFIPIDLEFKQDLPATIEITNGMPYISVDVQGYELKYQWFENTSASNVGGVAIDGETSNILKLSGSSVDRYFYVVVTDWLGDSITSSVQTIIGNSIITHTIVVSSGQNGQVSPSGSFEIAENQNITLTFIPDTGYEIEEVLLDGMPIVIEGNLYVLEDIINGHIIEVLFKLKTYTITFSGLNGTNSGNSNTYTYGSELILQDPESRKGHTFVGWYDAETGGNKITKISDLENDIMLWARWNVNNYTIIFNGLNGAKNNNSNTYTYGNGFILQNPENREGYTFDGWYDAETGGNKVTSISDTTIGDLTLWARWNLDNELDGLPEKTIIIIAVASGVVLFLTLLSMGIIVARKKSKLI